MTENVPNKPSSMVIFAEVVLILALGVPAAMLGGVVLRDIWQWFAVPVGAAPITHAQAVGLNIMASYFLLTVGLRLANLDPESGKSGRMLKLMLSNTLAMLLGWGVAALWHIAYVH